MPRSVLQEFPGSTIRELVVSNRSGWSANNPSIAWSPVEGYRFVVRSSNFRLDETGCVHISADPRGIISTRNHIGRMDSELQITELEEIDYSAVDGEISYPWVLGAEDSRLFWDHDEAVWKMSGSHRQHRSDGVPTIAVDTLDQARVVGREVLHRSDGYEKNWLPTGNGNEFIYGPWDQLRGSSQALVYEPGYLGVLHECEWPGRLYYHRLARFNLDGDLLRWSQPFYLKDIGVSFANGAVFWKDQLVISFGYRECRAFLAYIPMGEINAVFG